MIFYLKNYFFYNFIIFQYENIFLYIKIIQININSLTFYHFGLKLSKLQTPVSISTTDSICNFALGIKTIFGRSSFLTHNSISVQPKIMA